DAHVLEMLVRALRIRQDLYDQQTRALGETATQLSDPDVDRLAIYAAQEQPMYTARQAGAPPLTAPGITPHDLTLPRQLLSQPGVANRAKAAHYYPNLRQAEHQAHLRFTQLMYRQTYTHFLLQTGTARWTKEYEHELKRAHDHWRACQHRANRAID